MSDSANQAAKKLAKKVEEAREYASLAGPVFEQVHGYRDSKITIKGAENGAISLLQIQNLWKQVEIRCEKEGWTSTFDGSLLRPETVTLNDLMKYVILPLTVHRRCSYVEMVAQGPQAPIWFVSHWWGEPVKEFIQCLEQHAVDHELDAETAYYWVCAYANNQWKLDLGATLKESPFYKAMEKSTGTVSILDSKGVVFTRIWCGYELYVSLLNRNNHKWCVYTSGSKRAVGLTEGNAPADDEAWKKWDREKYFPVGLIEHALTVDIEQCKATEDKDRDLILETIGTDVEVLNSSLKGRFAVAGLPLILESTNNESKWFEFLEVINKGKAKTLLFNISSREQFNESKQEELRKHIDWKSLEKLTLYFNNLTLEDAGVIRIVNNWHFDKIVDLSLTFNEIGDNGAKAIGKGLESNTALKRLSLRDNKIGPDGAEAIAKAYLQSNNVLQELSLGKNQIGPNGAKAIATALESKNTLRTLDLFANKIGDAGAKAIVKGMESTNILQELNLGKNEIGPNGAETIAEALQRNRSLEQLRMGVNKIGDTGAKAIGKALKSNTALKELNLWYNNIGDAGAIAISKALESNTALKELNLQRNKIGPEGAKAISKALEFNTALKELNLRYNVIEEEGKVAVRSAWGNRSDRLYLY